MAAEAGRERMNEKEIERMDEPIYALLQVKVKDREKLAAYVQGHLPSFRQYGGELVIRGEGLAAIEGDWLPELFVVHKWPSGAAFRQWQDSPEYRPWRELRHEACDITITLARALG